ncbi:flagellar protein FliS [Vallitaleaceae bacterium 9-2]
MNKELVNEYQTRIVNASRKELLVINYEMLLSELEEALEGLDSDNNLRFEKAMHMAQKLLRELSEGLNFEYAISKELLSLYIYVNKLFLDAQVHDLKEPLEEAVTIIRILLDGWKQVESDEQEPVIANGQKVYAGLTYGKAALNESVDSKPNRGYKA